MTEPIVSAVLNRAADWMETRQVVGKFQAGPQTWVAVHAAATELVAGPVIEHLRKRLGVKQVQHWDATRESAVKELRDAAGAPSPDLASLQNDDAGRRIESVRRALLTALGYPEPGANYTIELLCADLVAIARDAQRPDRRRGPRR